MVARSSSQTAATHTATGNAAVALPGHSQVWALGTSCFFSQFSLVPTLCNNFNVFWDYIFLAGWSVCFGLRAAFCHHFWSQFWAPFLVPDLGTKSPQIRRLLMNFVFVAQFWHQIWSPKREPKTCNFLPRNPDTFQPNFEQNLTKIPKSWTREKHIANTQKDPNTCSKLAAQAGHHLPACAAYLQPGSATHTP